jgi:hypothetical protein
MGTKKTTKRGVRLNKNSKPILWLAEGEISHWMYKGASYKENGTYYFYVRQQHNPYVYNT